MSFCTSIVLAVHLFSHHAQHGFNNNNFGAGVECRQSYDFSIAVGDYYNSYRTNTVYAGVIYEPIHVGNLSVGGALAAASGYTPPVIGGISFRYQVGRLNLESLVVPSKYGVAHFMVGWRF